MNRTEECVYYNALFAIYGALLNEREQEIFSLFYEEDLSLQEIAYHRKVSKSAIGSAIKTITKKLDIYEEKLQFYKKIQELEKILIEIKDASLIEKMENIICK